MIRKFFGLLSFAQLFFISSTFASDGASQVFSVNYLNLMTGKRISIDLKQAGKKGTLVVFLSIICPCSHDHLPALKGLYEKFSSNFQFFAIHSNLNEPIQEAEEYFKKNFKKEQLPFPVLQDENLSLAGALGALKTPHAYILDSSGNILFRGGIDDVARPSQKSAREHYLDQALTEVMHDKKVKNSSVRVLGCSIR